MTEHDFDDFRALIDCLERTKLKREKCLEKDEKKK